MICRGAQYTRGVSDVGVIEFLDQLGKLEDVDFSHSAKDIRTLRPILSNSLIGVMDACRGLCIIFAKLSTSYPESKF